MVPLVHGQAGMLAHPVVIAVVLAQFIRRQFLEVQDDFLAALFYYVNAIPAQFFNRHSNQPVFFRTVGIQTVSLVNVRTVTPDGLLLLNIPYNFAQMSA